MGAGRPGAVRDHLTRYRSRLPRQPADYPGCLAGARRVLPAVACAAARAGVAGGVSTVSTAVAASTAASP